MDPLTIILLLIGAFLLFRGGGSSFFGGGSLGIGQPSPAFRVQPQPTYTTGFSVQSAQSATGAVNAATNLISSGLQVGTSLAKAVPIIGGALDAAISFFSQASQKRASQAKSENQAVANAIPGWDATIYQANQMYNNGQITAAQVAMLVDAAWSNYWGEVGSQIQPNRNGCQGGTMSKQQADSQFPGLKQCSGSWGAACCVGYADLANGANSVKAAVTQTEKDGKGSTAYIPAVLASKYGGVNRSSYTLTFVRPSSLFTI